MRQKNIVGERALAGVYTFESCSHIDDSQNHEAKQDHRRNKCQGRRERGEE